MVSRLAQVPWLLCMSIGSPMGDLLRQSLGPTALLLALFIFFILVKEETHPTPAAPARAEGIRLAKTPPLSSLFCRRPHTTLIVELRLQPVTFRMEIEIGSKETVWATVAGVLLLFVISRWFFWVTEFRYGSKLPKGSYGWPIVGETIAFLRLRGNPRLFISTRVQRYGKCFKTHLFGFPTFVTTDANIASKIYSFPTTVLRGHLPDSAVRIIGPQSFQFAPGKEHDAIHKVIQDFFFPQSLGPFIPELERLLLNHMSVWDGKSLVIKDEMKKVITLTIMYLFAGYGEEDDKLNTKVYELMDGGLKRAFMSLPINFPGTTFNIGLKTRDEMLGIAKKIIENRKHTTTAKSGGTLLDALLDYKDENGKHMSSAKITDSLMTVLFGAIDSTPSTFALTMKNLIEHPEMLELVKAEQEAIQKTKLPGEPLTPDDLKLMTYTNQVIHETMRNPGAGPFSTRKVVEDVQLGDYIVPKGWNIISFFPHYHFDPKNFPNPEKFDPTHFRESKKAFAPFGGGNSICAGRELAKLELKIMIHHFVTKFRWEFAGVPNPELEFFPACCPVDGLRLKMYAIKPTRKR